MSRHQGQYTNAAHADAWAALAAEILSFMEANPAPSSRTNNASPHPWSQRALADAMGLSNSRSTLRNMLRGTTRKDSDGARVPGPDKIKAARAWLRKARKEIQ